MKINKVNLTILRNEEHFQFMTDVKLLIETATSQKLNIDKIYPVFADFYNREDAALEPIRKHALTNALIDADTHRNSIYRGFTLLIQTYNYSTNPDKLQAAQNIQILIDHFGDVRNKSYNEETSTIYNFLQGLNDRHSRDIAALNAGDWLSDLDIANKKFAELMNQRYDDKAGKMATNLREIRKEIDSAYTQMINRINAMALLDEKDEFAEFISKMNERVDYYKNTLIMRKARSVSKKTADSQVS